MEFSKLTLDKIETLRPFFEDNRCRICDCTIGGTFMWRDYHKTEYTVEDGILYLKASHPVQAFAPPRGGDITRGSIERIIEYCHAANIPVMIDFASKTVLGILTELFPGSIAQTSRDWSDYLYLSADIIELTGRRYSGQRNHINRFTREHPKWSFERVNKNNVGDAKAFIEKNAQENIRDSTAYIEGGVKAVEVLDNLELYGQLGGLLYADGETIGVSLGEILGDTLFVHTEKADVTYHGSYPVLMNQFARAFAVGNVKYINREEDDGVEGLRTSKLSYHPVELLEKFAIEIR